MPFMRHRLRSEIGNNNETKQILAKIAELYAENPRHVSFEVHVGPSTAASGSVRFSAGDCTSVSFAPNSATNTVNFKRPGGSTVEHYDITDLLIIRRLRTRKWMIEIKFGANPA